MSVVTLRPAPTVLDGTSVELTDDRWTLRADRELSGCSGASFAEPAAFVSFKAADLGDGARFLGFSFAQFAMPVRAQATQPFVWDPADNVLSPPAVVPLVAETADGVILFGPLDSWHEQIVAVVQDDDGVDEFRWGWHGDLDEVPAGFSTTLGIFRAPSATAAFALWADELRVTHPVERHRDDPLMNQLSYWTDNGAAYWYRTEPGLDVATSLEHKLRELDDLGITIGSVELDSWFYRHETSRNVTELGELDEVPPTGMLEWTPRADVLPDGIKALQHRLGDRPLTLHSRHIAASSPYVDAGSWWVDLCAHPIDQTWFTQWFDDAQAWGATCIEQDWMPLYWFGVRQLRTAPGRARAWQRALNEAARERDMGLIFCMALPGDVLSAATLDRVIALRTCDDYRYADDPARLWRWYLTMNRWCAAFGLPAFKDCFFSSTDPGQTGLDGDVHAEVESLLAAFSGGIVGIGDRIGCTDPGLLRRLVDDDGSLATSDAPLALVDTSLFNDGSEATVSFAEAWSGSTRYVVALHLGDTTESVSASFELDHVQLVYDWRAQRADATDRIEVSLAHRDWALYVCCPISTDGNATIGDPSRYATGAGSTPEPLLWNDIDGLHH